MHIGHTYTSYAWDISEEAPIRPGLGIYQLSKGCGSEICRVFSTNYQIKVITALFFGFAGAWGDAGNLPFTITFSDAARLVRKCVEVDLASLPVRQQIAFILFSPWPYVSDQSDIASKTYMRALLRRCISVQATFNTFFATAPQPHGQYVSDKARRVLGWECQHSPVKMERIAAGKTQFKASL